MDLNEALAKHCSVGEPTGDGLKIGFQGWDVDAVLDPALPLDMSVRRLGLVGKFEKVISVNFLNYIHGDCFLTHAVTGLTDLLKPGGELEIRAVSTLDIAKDAIAYFENNQTILGQALEKHLFRPALDEFGLVFQQTFLCPKRLRLADSELLKIPVKPRFETPDRCRLDNISDKQWAQGLKNNIANESLSEDWPTCIVCDRLASKMDENRSHYSRYCKNHYHQARENCDKEILEAYSFVMRYKK